jgi:PAS domain S-box-containing protein
MRVLFILVRPVILAVFLFVVFTSLATAQPKAKNVLVLVGGRGRVSTDTMEASLRAHAPWPVNFTVADLDNPRFEEKPYRDSLAETFRREYSGEKLDLVVAVSEAALLFAVQYRDAMFPGVPIVFMSASSPLAYQLLEHKITWPGVTGVTSSAGIRETIDLALRLNPDTNAIAVITDVSEEQEREWLAAAHSELLRHQDKVREIDLLGAANAEMLDRVAALPPHTVVLFQLFPHDSNQPAIGTWDVLVDTTRRLPTYSEFSTLALGHGGVGGVYYDATKDAVLAGQVAARVLSGERADNIPVVLNSDLQVRVDWLALERWHIPVSALPAGSVILNRPPSLWESYRKYMIAVIVVIAVLLLLVIGLLWERATKQKAEARLRESEKRFRVMADTTPSLIWMCDSQGKITYLNDRRVGFTGRDPNAGYGDTWTTYIHPDDRKNVGDVVSQALKDRGPFSKEYRLRRSDGVYRWMFDVASPRVNGDGSFAGFIGSAIDVTDQKVAQQALQKVSGQLIDAQEKERSRIARELHDDICQRLALLSMEIEQAARFSNASPAEIKRNLEEVRTHCGEIAGDVQSLSHQLHSSKLDYLGIVSAIRGFCNEFSRQHAVSVEFTENNVPRHVPKDISLCLFRVAQEALHNALKHSGVTEFSVELTATADEILLVVSDSGSGFDVEDAKRDRGLGLVSMQERVHLVNGVLFVESSRGTGSSPGAGTKILAVVPLAPPEAFAGAGDVQVASVSSPSGQL